MTNGTKKYEEKLAENLKFFRKKAGLSQIDLCIQINVTEEYISKIERGIRTPSLKRLFKIAEALNIEPYELLK